MSKRKVSDAQRIVAWAMSVTEAELVAMSETITAIRDARFTTDKPKPRARRSDAGTTRKANETDDALSGKLSGSH